MEILIREDELKQIVQKYLEDKGHKVEAITTGVGQTASDKASNGIQFQPLNSISMLGRGMNMNPTHKTQMLLSVKLS